MKLHYPILFIVSLLLVAGCNDTPFVDEESTSTQHTFTLSASMPGSGDPSTRVAARQLPDSLDIALKWKEGDKIQLYFKSGDAITQGDEVEVQNISTNGKTADFIVEVPAGISGGFELYGVHGTTSEINGGAILLDATPGNFVKLEDAKVPLFFKQENVDPASPGQSVTFQHFGALQVITLRNTVNENITLGNPSLVFSGDKWYHDATDYEYPLYDIVSGEPATKTGSSPSSSQPFTVEIAYNDNVKLAQWVMPNGQNPPEVNLKAVIGGGEKSTTLQKEARDEPLQAGKAYHLYALWNGTDLTFANEADVQTYKITMTTSIIVGSTIGLYIGAAEADQNGVWIDLNNNGVKDDGEGVTVFGNYVEYTIASQTVTLYGKVTNLDCSFNSLTALDVSSNTALTELNCRYNSLSKLDVSGATALTVLGCNNNSLTALDVSNNTVLTDLDCSYNSLTALDVSQNTALTNLGCTTNSLDSLDVSHNTELIVLLCCDNSLTALDVSNNTALTTLVCFINKINGKAMDNLVGSLPDRSAQTKGYFWVINTDSDGNVCTTTQVNTATGKNWEVMDSDDNPYPGS